MLCPARRPERVLPLFSTASSSFVSARLQFTQRNEGPCRNSAQNLAVSSSGYPTTATDRRFPPCRKGPQRPPIPKQNVPSPPRLSLTNSSFPHSPHPPTLHS